MIDRLRAFLKQPTVALVFCGSVRDEHINEVIVQGLQSTQTAIAFGLLYGKLSDYPAALALANKRANLTVLARDGAVVSAREVRWPE
ncbi:MAG: SIR2 family protein, partial [Acidimicrobiia bacterium]